MKNPAMRHSPAIPFDPKVNLYSGFGGNMKPYEFTGWRDETMSWKTTAYLAANLNPQPTFMLQGPEALKFLSDHCVNNFEWFPVGTCKHAVMCREDGIIMIHGALIRTGDDEYYSYALAPYIDYLLAKGGYDAVGENISGKVFLFQVAGPRSLEILEEASGDNLHDIKFARHRMSRIAGKDVRILRIGMAGTLAYEVHGVIDDALEVYTAIYEAGQAYGIRRLGQLSYSLFNHTEAGFPQGFIHFPYPWHEDEGFVEYLKKTGQTTRLTFNLRGSSGQDITARYRNPVELGWGGMIKFNHEFVGREALEKEVANPRRKMVTLVWNKEDIIDVYASQFEPGEPYANMDRPSEKDYLPSIVTYYADKVLKDGREVGISSGRIFSCYYREMISLCSIDVEFSELGTEVIVLWGEEGTRQKGIRAVISRFPYLNENRNTDVDVSTIPVVSKT